MRALLLTLVCLLCCTCSTSLGNPPGSGGEPLRELARVNDVNPDPRIIEFDLVALVTNVEVIAGKSTKVWTYNGLLPGPLIEANVGDEIVVHFLNQLPEETTIHWHGVRLPHAMDGAHASQQPVPPGGTFEYRFSVPDSGLFWYHPHVNGSRQVARGMYGALLVHGRADTPVGQPGVASSSRADTPVGHQSEVGPALLPAKQQADRSVGPTERVLMLSDIRLDDAGQVIDPPAAHDMTPVQHALGIEGNVLLVNGQVEPRIEMQRDVPERWRIVNACTSRYIDLSIGGQSLHVLGLDNGIAEQPVTVSDLLLIPGERADLLVDARTDSNSAELLSLPYSKIHGFVYDPGPARKLAGIAYSGAPTGAGLPQYAHAPLQLPDPVAQRGIQFNAALDPDLETQLPRETHAMHDGVDEANRFMIGQRAFPNVPVIESRLGTVEQWNINNHSVMDHPFHLHGFRFLVLDVDGVAPQVAAWKDTVNLPGSLEGDVFVRLLVSFEGHPGLWPYHCHILHHQELGMMAEVNVTP